MTGMETRGERLARNSARARKARWITDDPDPTYSRLDTLDGLPRTEGTDMPRRETHIPELPQAPLVTREEWLAWGAVAVFSVIILGVLYVAQLMVGAR